MTTLIRRRKLYEEVADRIEDMIRNGRFRTGDSLPSEREFSEMFGVGRNAVREALFSLQKIGIVNVSSGERARVTRPTAEALMRGISGAIPHLIADETGMRYLQDARALFEIGLARYAALHAEDEDIARLGRRLQKMSALLVTSPSLNALMLHSISQSRPLRVIPSLTRCMKQWPIGYWNNGGSRAACRRRHGRRSRPIIKFSKPSLPVTCYRRWMPCSSTWKSVQHYYWKYIESHRERR